MPHYHLNIEQDFILVLTACINPNNNPFSVRSDPVQREQDYIEGLIYYLTHHPRVRRVVLIENSGWPLERLRQTADRLPHGKKVELVSLNCNDYPRELGKGYGEFLLLDYGFTQSSLLREGGYIGKITGRLKLHNLTKILEKVRCPFDLLCDMHDHQFLPRIGIHRTAAFCDTRFLVFSRPYYDHYIRGAYKKMNDSKGIYAEHVLFAIVKATESKERISPRLPLEANWEGRAGWGTNYNSSKNRLKYYLRSMLRQLAPWVHI